MTTFLRQMFLLPYILILHFVGHTLTFAQPEFLYYNCTNSANYTSPSTYQTNLNTLLSSLSSNIDRYGYYNSSIGKSPDIVTAVALCRGDVQLDICRSCVDDSISKLTQVCPNQKEAIAWYDKCMLRYTNQTIIFGTMERDPGFKKGNDKLFVPNEYMNAFVELRTTLFVDLRAQAASGDSLRKYATGSKMIQNYNETMYSLVQCTPDLSKSECSKCITACVDLIPDCCNKSAGGAVYKPTCNLRYELGGTSAFYTERVSATFTLTNKCEYTVWPGLLTNGGNASLSNTTTGFALKNGDSNTINVPSSWNGRIWGRSLCSEDSTGNFTCVTGDCGSNEVECAGGRGPSPPTTFAEISLNSIDGQDFYDVSLVDGYNLPMLVEPQGGTGTSCLSTGCVVDLNGLCPSDLKVTMITAADGGNNTVACRNACQAFQEPQYCCTGAYATPETCNPHSYSIFKNACPRAYSYAFDDATSTFTCGSFPDYLITFCPYPTTTSKEPSTDQGQGSTNTEGKKSNTTRNVIIIVVVSTVGFLILVVIYIFIRLKKNNQRKQKQKIEIVDGMSTLESLQYDFDTVKVATDKFSDANKLGQGGFGSVYKGIFPNGHEFAVKRLSQGSGQGEVEFKNEVLLMAKLQHRNLVRLLGFCLEGIERLLIYEFVINGSLDHFIFDKTDREKLDWEKRNKIIGGIARGLLYLHEDSRLRIIHRDLKASNILLDEAMAAKIADFGMAMCFVLDESHAKTSMVAGTYGYMAPEVLQGQISVKSDVFSFGVLVLEIVSGNKITKPFGDEENAESLLSYAWRMWREGTPSNLIDPTMKYGSSSTRDIMRCIHIGLLCVQENVVKRPNMATVVLMLSSISFTLAVPTRPAFSLHSISETEMPLLEASHNEASITELHPR